MPFYIASIPPENQPPGAVESNQSFTQDMLSASLGFFVLFSSFVLLLCSMRRWKTPDETPTFSEEMKSWSDKMAFDVPCRNCHYFKANRYLPCAVNPMEALTEEAANCGDFRERDIG